MVAYLRQGGETVLDRHLQIEENQVGAGRLQAVDDFLAVAGLDNPAIDAGEDIANQLAAQAIVVGNQQRPHDHFSPCATAVRSRLPGPSEKKNRLPQSGVLSTQTFPPCRSTSRLVMASPSPVPSLTAPGTAPTWWNSSKTASSSALGIPTPVSPTQKQAVFSLLHSATQTRPFSSVNLTALLSRL